MAEPRNLVDVIDQIVRVAPDLERHLTSVRDGCLYSSPEMMPHRWGEVAFILNSVATGHPMTAEIARIFSGRE